MRHRRRHARRYSPRASFVVVARAKSLVFLPVSRDRRRPPLRPALLRAPACTRDGVLPPCARRREHAWVARGDGARRARLRERRRQVMAREHTPWNCSARAIPPMGRASVALHGPGESRAASRLWVGSRPTGVRPPGLIVSASNLELKLRIKKRRRRAVGRSSSGGGGPRPARDGPVGLMRA